MTTDRMAQDVPAYQLRIDHPRFGWVVVGIFYNQEAALKAKATWTERYPKVRSNVTHMCETTPQCWEVIA